MLLATLLASCGASFGEKYTRGNLEIYYTDEIAMHYVEDLASYFDKENLIQPKKHSVQITSDSKTFILKMILNEDYETLPKEQENALFLLEQDIAKEVFNGVNLKIEVCDINFNRIRNTK